ncbi:hypothetical protein B0H66DRAFT_594094 [Apodospora peruviana]|uniref:Uncharacterized protein n=1 Tax=Apodospora peruviana TaxID=516989 RepID=A0AAE0HZ40_9PEZI|nr:hypothetical protein B0H66DRAFT_594094 [Apodospora peruviana]
MTIKTGRNDASSSLAQLGDLQALDAITLEGLSPQQKDSIIAATGQICRMLMQDLGVRWKPQPVDSALRSRLVQWIKTELEPEVGPVDKRFLIGADTGLTYTERVYEGGDFETKVSMAKYLAVLIYLDDMIDNNAAVAKEAESFLVKTMMSSNHASSSGDSIWLEEYKKVILKLSKHIPDPFVSNMLLHSCTLCIEGSALEYRIQRDQAKYFLIEDADKERVRDDAERKLADDYGVDISLPLDQDRIVTGDRSEYLAPHGWPLWLRERTGVAEPSAIVSFRAPGGIDLPTWLWVTAIPELRTVINAINDILSFPKEFLADDTTSPLTVMTKERRLIGMPGTAPDGGWCLRDSFEEVLRKTVVSGARINRLLRPTAMEARYTSEEMGGRPYSVVELVAMLQRGLPEDDDAVVHDGQGLDRLEVMKALALRLWETHQRGYVAWHFQTPRYRMYEHFDWVKDMMGCEAAATTGPQWLTSCF